MNVETPENPITKNIDGTLFNENANKALSFPKNSKEFEND